MKYLFEEIVHYVCINYDQLLSIVDQRFLVSICSLFLVTISLTVFCSVPITIVFGNISSAFRLVSNGLSLVC